MDTASVLQIGLGILAAIIAMFGIWDCMAYRNWYADLDRCFFFSS